MKEIKNPKSGISALDLVYLLPPDADVSPSKFPSWSKVTKDFRVETREKELPRGYKKAFIATVPLMQSSPTLEYLMGLASTLGAKFVRQKIESLKQFANGVDASVIVNCTGLGSRELVADSQVHSIRGQIVMVRPPRGVSITRGYLDEEAHNNLAYVIPRSEGVLMGGTAEMHEYDDSCTDPAEVKAIIQRCAAILPDLSSAEIIKTYAGLRPGREKIRLEPDPSYLSEARPNSPPLLIHNYGHGGSGWSLCWGCASDVVKLSDEYVRTKKSGNVRSRL